MIIGSYLSPYVRKVLVCLYVKGVTYRIDPTVPFWRRRALGLDGDLRIHRGALPDAGLLPEWRRGAGLRAHADLTASP